MNTWTLDDVRALCRGLGYQEIPNRLGLEAYDCGDRGLTIDSAGIIRCGARLGGGFTPPYPAPWLAVAWLLDLSPFA